MLWVIWDILVPLALAFLGGLLFGWLFWRWRRMQITSEELAAIRRSSARYKSDADTLRNRNAELAERLRSSPGTVDSTALQDLAAANKTIDKLREQLKTVKRELSQSQKNRHAATQPATRSGASRLRSSSADKVQELEAQLSAARRHIHDLEGTARNAQGVPPQGTDSGYYEEQIVVRDKLIATLTHSLEQYGEQQDTTALQAENEILRQRINGLENLLNDAQRVA